jgi:hypothetical protein
MRADFKTEKAALKRTQSRRSAQFQDAGMSRSVWSAVASAPLSNVVELARFIT